MTIPLSTTTVAVYRSDQDGTLDATDTLVYTLLAAGVRAVIGSPGGSETNTGGSSEQTTHRLDCDPTDLAHDDRIVDESTGDSFEVLWTRRRIGFGLDHTVADLLLVNDRAEVA